MQRQRQRVSERICERRVDEGSGRNARDKSICNHQHSTSIRERSSLGIARCQSSLQGAEQSAQGEWTQQDRAAAVREGEVEAGLGSGNRSARRLLQLAAFAIAFRSFAPTATFSAVPLPSTSDFH